MDIKTKGILAYLVIAFGVAWTIWEIPAQKELSFDNPVFQVMILVGSFGPAIACIVVRKWITREGFSDAGLKLNFRRWRYYLAAWVLPLVVALAVVGLALLFRIGEPDFSPHDLEARVPIIQLLPVPSQFYIVLIAVQLMLTAAIMAPLLFGEEFGWRSYLQIRLFSDRPVLAAVATGIIWGVWHSPLNLRGYNYPDHPILGLFLFPVVMMFLSIPLGWLRLKSESIWPACLGHAGVGIIGSSLTMYVFASPDSISRLHLEVLALIAIVVLSVWIIITGRLTPED